MNVVRVTLLVVGTLFALAIGLIFAPFLMLMGNEIRTGIIIGALGVAAAFIIAVMQVWTKSDDAKQRHKAALNAAERTMNSHGFYDKDDYRAAGGWWSADFREALARSCEFPTWAEYTKYFRAERERGVPISRLLEGRATHDDLKLVFREKLKKEADAKKAEAETRHALLRSRVLGTDAANSTVETDESSAQISQCASFGETFR